MAQLPLVEWWQRDIGPQIQKALSLFRKQIPWWQMGERTPNYRAGTGATGGKASIQYQPYRSALVRDVMSHSAGPKRVRYLPPKSMVRMAETNPPGNICGCLFVRGSPLPFVSAPFEARNASRPGRRRRPCWLSR